MRRRARGTPSHRRDPAGQAARTEGYVPSPTRVGAVTVGWVLLLAIAVSRTVRAGTMTVTDTGDAGAGTLRQALIDASDSDTIDATGVSGTILLTGGELLVAKNVTIVGPGAANLAVNGNASSRVFHVAAGETVSISGLTITNGFASGAYPANQGGGVWNDHASLTLGNCVVTGNSSAAGDGGGVINDAFDHGSATLEIDGCTISDNSASCAGGFCPNGAGIRNVSGTVTVTNSMITGNHAGYEGGGIGNTGNVTLTNTIVSGNSAGSHGGGISSSTGTLTVDGSSVSNNTAGGAGGGIFNDYSGTPTVIDSTISGNSSVDGGGGIDNLARNPGLLTVFGSTISGNSYSQADQGGGGIANSGDAIVVDSTISGNSGPNYGGGIVNLSYSLVVKDCTFADNSAGSGGAIFNWTGGTTQIANTVLKAGASGGTLFNNSGAITSLGYNVAGDGGGGFLTATGDRTNTDPMLGPLQSNGGPTFTHALLPGSPAIDAGDPAFDPNAFNPPLSDDQRGSGFPRIVNGRIDVGAFELQGSGTTTTTSTSTTSSTTSQAPATTTTTTASTTTTTIAPRGKSRCTAKQLAAAGQKAAALATCHSKAIAKGRTSALQACIGKVQSKFSTAYAKATRVGHCRTSTGAGTVETAVDAFIGELDTTLDGGSTSASKCAAGEWNAAGARATSTLACDAKAAAKGVTPSMACPQKADTKFFSAFGKATKRGGCLTVADATTVEGQVNGFVSEVASLLAP